MRSKIFILTFIVVFALSGVACAQDLKYAIIQIPMDPDRQKDEEVKIFFVGEEVKGKEVKGETIDGWPIKVKPEHKVRYIDSAFWYISNPVCVVWDGKTF